jgi:hypothetical protein
MSTIYEVSLFVLTPTSTLKVYGWCAKLLSHRLLAWLTPDCVFAVYVKGLLYCDSASFALERVDWHASHLSLIP